MAQFIETIGQTSGIHMYTDGAQIKVIQVFEAPTDTWNVTFDGLNVRQYSVEQDAEDFAADVVATLGDVLAI